MKKKPDYPLIDLNSSPKPAKRSRVIQTPTSQSQITQTYGAKSNYPLLDLNSSPTTEERVQVGQTSPSQCQITQASCSKTNYPLLDLNSSPKPDKRVQVGQTPTSQSQITQTTICLGKPSGYTPVPEENNCHIRNLQDAFANASFSPTDKADESTVEFTTPTISVSRKSVERKAVTQTINQPKKRGRPRKNVPTKRAAAKAKKTG
ncbi:predicted protein [Arabidopsis lyrata subsp. lyrata]|uniref:Predicted protein n=1 Tax=Arabidopsis lyrata subsp. lyrata TaxID=81972 RepID=D7M6M7_ARALL|nr:predicted protein [Arabidopsis lyrata subsp. lyrata]